MSISRHDELLLKDLKFQSMGLLIFYIVIGVVSLSVGLMIDASVAKWLCAGGGFLIALGAEKLVSRRVRGAALSLIQARGREESKGDGA